MLNNGGPRYKRSKLEKKINTEVVWCVIILFILCLIGAIGTGAGESGYDLSEHPVTDTLYRVYPPFCTVCTVHTVWPFYQL